MSRIYDALRRSGQGALRADEPDSAARLLEALETRQRRLPQIAEERAHPLPEAHLVVHDDATNLGAERFRQLRTRLLQHGQEKPVRTVLVVSSAPREGKTVTILNLATALAKKPNTKVLVLDGDMRKPSVSRLLGISARPGLAEILQGKTSYANAMRAVSPLNFYFIPAGDPPVNPLDLLQSQVLVDLMKELASGFDWILLDSPPLALVADAQALAAHADGILLVVRPGLAERDNLTEAIKTVGVEKVLGIVLNGLVASNSRYERYFSTRQGSTPISPQKKIARR